MKNSAELERCADFLARMIEKYGDEIDFPKDEKKSAEEDQNHNVQYDQAA